MIYRSLKLTILSLTLAIGIFAGASSISTQTVSAQSGGSISLFLPFVTSSTAIPTINTNAPFASLNDEESELLERAIQEMEQNIAIGDDGQLIYDALVPLSPDINPEMQKMLLDSLAEANRQLTSGELALDELSWGEDEDSEEDALVSLGRCRGVTDSHNHWWGKHVRYNSCASDSMEDKLQLVATGAAACTVLSGGWLAPACGLGAAYYGRIAYLFNKKNVGRGVKTSMTWVGVITKVGSQ